MGQLKSRVWWEDVESEEESDCESEAYGRRPRSATSALGLGLTSLRERLVRLMEDSRLSPGERVEGVGEVGAAMEVLVEEGLSRWKERAERAEAQKALAEERAEVAEGTSRTAMEALGAAMEEREVAEGRAVAAEKGQQKALERVTALEEELERWRTAAGDAEQRLWKEAGQAERAVQRAQAQASQANALVITLETQLARTQALLDDSHRRFDQLTESLNSSSAIA